MEKMIYLDAGLCVGCGACVVACMDQNDIFPEKGQPAFRRIYSVEKGRFPNVVIHYISVACMHCAKSPCLEGCPTGAIVRDKRTNAIVVDTDLCIGCHSCAEACPLGIPRFDSEEKMQKCNLCSERVDAGLLPACVRVCPVGALKFASANELMEEKELKIFSNLLAKKVHANCCP